MPGPDDDSRGNPSARLLGYIGAAGAILCLVTVVGIVILQTLLPAFGLDVGGPSDWVVVSMLMFVLVTIGAIPGAAFLGRWRDR